MPRLVFDLQPLEPWWTRDEKTQAEHDAGVQEFWAQHYPGEEPTPCDCGFYAGGPHVTYCHPRHRERECYPNVEKRLENHYRTEHERRLRDKRAFPALPFKSQGGRCKWCGGAITLGRASQREWHDGRGDEPDCFGAYCLHTRLDVQQGHLLDRDGPHCRGCGCRVAERPQTGVVNAERWRAWGPSYVRKYPVDLWVGDFCSLQWAIRGAEVDHHIALAVAWEAFSDDARRRWFFSPANLRLLCPSCHKAKTKEDVALLKLCYERGPEWARVEVLRRLNDAGLIRRK